MTWSKIQEHEERGIKNIATVLGASGRYPLQNKYGVWLDQRRALLKAEIVQNSADSGRKSRLQLTCQSS